MEPADYQAKRLDADLSFSELERRTGYTRTHISRVESGKNTPSKEYEAAFLAALKGKISDSATRPGITATARSQQVLARYARRMDANHEVLERARKSLSSLINDVQSAATQAWMLSESQNEYDSEGFNPLEATAEQVAVLDRAIVSVVVEILTEHNVHLLEPAIVRDYVERCSGKIITELAKQKARAEQIEFTRAGR